MSEESDKGIAEEGFVKAERLEVAAYFKWRYRGCPEGDPLRDWADAPKELIQAAR